MNLALLNKSNSLQGLIQGKQFLQGITVVACESAIYKALGESP